MFRCLIAAGSPFRAVENKQFKLLIQKLRPGTTTPSKRYLRGQLLDEVDKGEKNGTLWDLRGAECCTPKRCLIEFGLEVCAMVTENAVNMTTLRRQFFAETGTHISGCSVHFANLLNDL